jgi:hypothetical protein
VPQSWLLSELDMAWTRARFKDNESDGITIGPAVPSSVDRVLAGTLTLKDAGPWTASLTERYIGLDALTSDNSVRSSSSPMTNVRLIRRFRTRSILTLDVLNLVDRHYNDIEYYHATQPAGAPAPVSDQVVRPSEPRAV